MYRLIKSLFATDDLQTVKKRKIAQTNAYLRAHRRIQPQTPIGFKSRNSASYYLTTHHKY